MNLELREESNRCIDSLKLQHSVTWFLNIFIFSEHITL